MMVPVKALCAAKREEIYIILIVVLSHTHTRDTHTDLLSHHNNLASGLPPRNRNRHTFSLWSVHNISHLLAQSLPSAPFIHLNLHQGREREEGARRTWSEGGKESGRMKKISKISVTALS